MLSAIYVIPERAHDYATPRALPPEPQSRAPTEGSHSSGKVRAFCYPRRLPRFSLMLDDTLENMRERSKHCRSLARLTRNERMRWQLLDWANEIQADADRLMAEHAERSQRRCGYETGGWGLGTV